MKKILIIDDKNENLITSEAILQDNFRKCKTFKAISGKEGIKIAIKEQPDVILLDIVMPEMDGYQACKKLKKDKRTNHIPIILITAVKIDTQSRIKGLNSGADAFLSKPIDTNEFIAQVNTMLRIKEAEDKLRNETEKLRKTLEEHYVKSESETESRISTEALLEHRYQQIYQLSPDSIIIHDLDMNILDANNKAVEEFGYSKKKLLKLKVFVLHPETQLQHSTQVLAEMNKKELMTVETEFVRKDGSIFIAEATPCKYMLGSKEIIYVVIRDITERKQAEEQIKAKSLLLESLIQQSPLPTFVMDSKGFNVIVNEAFLKLYAVPDKDMILGRNALTEPANVSQGVVKYFKEALSGKIVEIPEIGFISPYENKNVITRCKLFPILDPTGTLTNVVVMQEDITERKQVEEAIKTAETTYRNIFRNSQIGLFRTDVNTGQILDANDAVARFIGYENRSELLAEPFSITERYVDPKNREEIASLLKEHGEFRNYEARYRQNDGSIIWMRFSARIVPEKGWLEGVSEDITAQKLTEDALIESETKFREMAEMLPQIVFEIDMLGNLTYLNKQAYKLSGYSEQDSLIGKSALIFFIPADVARTVENIKLSLANKKALRAEYTMLRKDGSTFDAMSYSNPILKENKIVGLRGIIVDISEIKQTEKALKKSEAKFKKLSNLTFEGIVLHQNGIAIDINLSFAETFGYTHEEVIGKNVVKLIFKEEYHNLISQNIIKNYTLPYEVVGVRKDGTELPLEIEARDIESDDKIIRVAAVRVIIERKKFEQNLIESKKELKEKYNQLNLIMESGNIGWWDWDITSGVEVYNNILPELLEYEIDEIKPHISWWKNKIHHLDLKQVEVGLQEHFEGKTDFYINEHRLKTKSNKWKWFLDYGKVIERDKDGQPTRMIGTLRVIEEQKNKEKELQGAKEHAEESDRLKSAFLTNMSHEIRTPMNGILGFAELLKEPGLTGEKQQEYISIIEKGGARMLNIINDIVSISRIESGQMQVKIKESNINEQIEYIYTFFKPEVEGKGMQFSFKNTLPEKKAFLKTDTEKVYAIVTNLIKNAIKYTEKGSIEMGVSLRQAQGAVGEPVEPDELEFYVKDTGIGIPKDRQDAIFVRFIQADIEDVMARQGAGLGLAISKAYVEILGGKIWVESEEGKGSTFYFTLPYQTETIIESSVIKEILKPVETAPTNKLKILIAEDDETSEIFISIAVKKFGKEIISVRTGTEAVAACRNNRDIDLVLMDIDMPEMNGYEATRQIRKFNKDVIIIAQTAYALLGDNEKAIAAGCDDYIPKPIKTDELLKKIEKLFS